MDSYEVSPSPPVGFAPRETEERLREVCPGGPRAVGAGDRRRLAIHHAFGVTGCRVGRRGGSLARS